MPSRRTIRPGRALIASILSLVILMLALPGATIAAQEKERERSCSARSDWYLYVGKEDGRRLEVEFEVDSERRGQAWRVVLKNDGQVFFRGKRTTNASGEFEVKRFTRDGRGTDRIVARAKNLSTGEVCRGVIRL